MAAGDERSLTTKAYKLLNMKNKSRETHSTKTVPPGIEWWDLKIELTDAQSGELCRLRSYFPFRIVWGEIDPVSGKFASHADHTRRRWNAAIRAGKQVFGFINS